ncbi:hypothetical protein ABEH27_20880 [Pseudomonas sp. P39-UII1]|uniref:hypothetical protein n=1 Tax=Pseudomonas sp. P39-UII1 TaxID=3080333 RepID=UPI0032092EC7
MQPGATRFFRRKGATRLAKIPTSNKGLFTVHFRLKKAFFAPKRSKSKALAEIARAGATCK